MREEREKEGERPGSSKDKARVGDATKDRLSTKRVSPHVNKKEGSLIDRRDQKPPRHESSSVVAVQPNDAGVDIHARFDVVPSKDDRFFFSLFTEGA